MKYLSRINPSLLLSISLTMMFLGVLSVAVLLNLVPDGTNIHLDARARISEALTIQLTKAATSDNIELIRDTLSTVQHRDPEILSIGLRNAEGVLLAQTDAHIENWKTASPGKSTQTHVRVPITDGSSQWGSVEIAFSPVQQGNSIFGISYDLLRLSGFLGISCFVGIYLLLRSILRELDPKRSVPKRVQSAFDSLADGVVIIDEKDNILLINQSLAVTLGEDQSNFVGKNLSGLLWRHWSKEGQAAEFPWMTALRENRAVQDVPMNLRSSTGTIINVLVNATCISNNRNMVTGALVTLKDVTVLERKNRDLSLAYGRLQASESEIKKQNNQLKYLASHDPLTSCMNRRSFFESFEEKFVRYKSDNLPVTCLMIDIDHFKNVNDTLGHAIGDDVINGVAQLLKRTCGDHDIVGRYGGEEFCMVLDGSDVDQASRIAEQLRQNVKTLSKTWLQNQQSLTVSIGIAPLEPTVASVNEVVDRADRALYGAKQSGRDRAVLWNSTGMSDIEPAPIAATEMPNAEAASGELSMLGISTTFEQFLERLNKSMSQSKRDGKSVAVVCVSLDSLDQYQEAFGPQVAKTILGAVENRLNAIFRDSDTVSLMSGKERLVSLTNLEDNRFLIELTHIDDSTSVAWILQRLSDKLSAPLRMTEKGIELRYSIGACLYPHDGLTENDIVHNAILAQKKALELGGDRAYRLFSNDMFEMVQEQIHVETGIREAIAKNEFHLYFQPIIDLSIGKVSAVEVLLRSSNPYLKNTSTDAVIEVAERTGLIHELSDYVLRTAFSIMSGWKRAGMELPLVSINISARQLKNKDIVFSILRHLENFQLEPSSVQLEMTETAMVTDIEQTSDVLRTFQSYGFHVALDDFGTGQSSLSHLLEINPDAIKIDRSFIHSLTVNYTNRVLVTTITELSKKIGAKVIAEGVETTEQLDILVKIGCRYVQGYLFSPPLPADGFKDWYVLFSNERTSVIDQDTPRRKSV